VTYLKNKHLEIKGKDLPKKLKIIDDLALTPQQENRVDCGVFVCYFMDFILDGCNLDFNQMLVSYGVWRDRIVLLIDAHTKSVRVNDDDNDKVIEIEKPANQDV
jgi:hypothetical protein